MFSKKAIASVVSISLLMILTVISVVSYSFWFSDYYSSRLVGVEQDTSNSGVFEIEELMFDKLYLNLGSNYEVVSLSIEDSLGTYCDVLSNSNEDLVGFWNFDSVSGSNILDLSEFSNDGVNNGLVEFSNSLGISDSYGVFNGDNFFSIPHDDSLKLSDDSGSVFAWFRFEDNVSKLFNGNTISRGILHKQAHSNPLTSDPFGFGIYRESNSFSDIKLRVSIGSYGAENQKVSSVWCFESRSLAFRRF